MISFALAAWRDWRDRLAFKSLASAAMACVVAGAFSALAPLVLSGTLAACFSVGGWFAARRYGPGSWGRERIRGTDIKAAAIAGGVALSGLAGWAVWVVALAPPAALVAASWNLGAGRLASLAFVCLGCWTLALGAGFLASATSDSEGEASGAWLGAIWMLASAIFPAVRFLNPFLQAWNAVRGGSDGMELAGAGVQVALGLLALLAGGAAAVDGRNHDAA